MFQTFQPGQTITTSVNAAKSYRLTGISNAKVTAIQGFKYVTGSTVPMSLKDMAVCSDVSSSTIDITLDQSKIAA
jgi:deuterolysin